eukprot:NODE_9276_length_375_cov_56.837423_g8375_i0.p1 GENE.NODE_9276_length_375_cov_56.837423_g8375_i0~~NODE_9276_length_375_cov_56.837423_g8375_i0.p1  ORF type:complete len:77 (-),score=5.36 NODE_9276_length_375_cov_56.837423_g8375_i0:68-298(-)
MMVSWFCVKGSWCGGAGRRLELRAGASREDSTRRRHRRHSTQELHSSSSFKNQTYPPAGSALTTIPSPDGSMLGTF